ncbi:hypothetical protein U6B65_11025 [Oscillospiraceae bacterium MB08-C2-2]|nr:hypothetical protein U6B65_11025 [Oscillospiraceae bacterium MB08-C2-2]
MGYRVSGEEITLRAGGLVMAAVQSYSCKISREPMIVWAYGEEQPAKIGCGPKTYTLELHRLRLNPGFSDGVDFSGLSDFQVEVRRPGKTLLYEGCCWKELTETAGLEGGLAEKIVVLAASCREMAV